MDRLYRQAKMNLEEQLEDKPETRQEEKFGQPDTTTIHGIVCCDTKAEAEVAYCLEMFIL